MTTRQPSPGRHPVGLFAEARASAGARWIVACLAIGLLTLASVRDAAAQAVNLALNKPVTRSSDVSSGRANSAVDGNVSTFWQALMADRQDDSMVWIRVDLGSSQSLDKTILNFRSGTSSVEEYRVLVSDDDATWQLAASRNRSSGNFPAIDTLPFALATGRYVRIEFRLNDPVRNFQLNELEVYNEGGPPPVPTLEAVFFTDAGGRVYTTEDVVTLSQGAQTQVFLRGRMSTGTTADLTSAGVTLQSSKPAVGTMTVASGAGTVSALQPGVTRIDANVTLDGNARSASLWVDVFNPATVVADIWITHPTMTIDIGQPAVIAPGGVYPTLHVRALVDFTLTGDVVTEQQQTVASVPSTSLQAGVEIEIPLTGTADRNGLHQMRLQIVQQGQPVRHDAFFFTVMDPAQIPVGQSRIAFPGADGRMTYVPDYKGNRVMDFSNSGYMGGGVRLPDVQTRIPVWPGDGDDTARIQQAIDLVAQLPPDADGIRGAVLLMRGTYEVGGTLLINASGIILRGRGSEEDDTVLFATGTTPRAVIEIRGTAARMLLNPRTFVSDLFVPTGAPSFHVENASGFRVGDTVLVRRVGNDRWIHYIAMDRIFQPPSGAPTTEQWGPFNLDFDRVITAINGNVVTVDAPIANSIERRWGGAELIRYDDPDRVEQVGIENLRVRSEFDPSVTDVNDGVTYYSDENHAVDFTSIDNAKNVWVRDVASYHFQHSAVEINRGAKWVTVQDMTSLDMVSLLDGSRRYAYLHAGQLSLFQRTYAETARHAFIVDSRIPGPNVFLNSQSVNEFTTSEPHHRWSAGGLYDNIKGGIAFQDRAWFGTGHGWSGANYVAWNTEGNLLVQQPPTAQNYALGHVGPKVRGLVPSSYDPRPRKDGFWESQGLHLTPGSLYLQQLQDRLGPQAVANIERRPVGGGFLDLPWFDVDLPYAWTITVDNRLLKGFSPFTFEYRLDLAAGTAVVPTVRAVSPLHVVEVRPAFHPNGKTLVIVRSRRNPEKSVRYTLRFVTQP